MTQRGMTAAVQAEAAATQNRPMHLVELRLDSGSTCMTDGYRSVEWQGRTYLALGDFLTFSGLVESTRLQVADVRVTLSGVTGTLVALVLSAHYVDRPLLIHKAFQNSRGEAIVDPVAIFEGRVSDGPVIEEDPEAGTCVVQVSASNHNADFARRIGRRTNHAVQQRYFSGDLAFEFASEIPGKVRPWGRPSP